MLFDVEPLQGSVLLFAILPWVSPTAINILPLWGRQTLKLRTLMITNPHQPHSIYLWQSRLQNQQKPCMPE